MFSRIVLPLEERMIKASRMIRLLLLQFRTSYIFRRYRLGTISNVVIFLATFQATSSKETCSAETKSKKQCCATVVQLYDMYVLLSKLLTKTLIASRLSPSQTGRESHTQFSSVNCSYNTSDFQLVLRGVTVQWPAMNVILFDIY